MASRDVLDGHLDNFKDQLKDGQDAGRAASRWGRGYGQVLRGNVRPSDQAEDGPQLPANLKNDARIDVYEATNGFGWSIIAEAGDGGKKTGTSHEGGPLIFGPWVEPIEVFS